LPEIPEAEQTPLVRALMRIIGQQQEWIEHLEDEIRQLKGGPRKPRLKPSALENEASRGSGEDSEGEEKTNKRPRGKPRRAKTEQLTIHETKPVEAPGVPDGSEFK
jgi:hypothetical protein